MIVALAALALEIAAPDPELEALVRCQFAVSREESARRTSVAGFERAVRRACAAEEARFSRRASLFFVARGRSPAEAQGEVDRALAEGRRQLLESYARALELSR